MKIRFRALFTIPLGFLLGLLAGQAAKALTVLDPMVTWFFVGWMAFFVAGSCWISGYLKAGD